MADRIAHLQIELLEKSKHFLHGKGKSDYQLSNPENYLSVWATGSLGSIRMQSMRGVPDFFKIYLRAILRNIKALGYERAVVLDEVRLGSQYKKVVISWCTQSDFGTTEAVKSRYFNCLTSDVADALWVLIPLDGYVPAHQYNNVVFLNRERSPHFSWAVSLRNFFFCVRRGLSLTPEALFAQQFAEQVTAKVDLRKVSALLTLYEAQPWQHALCARIREYYPHVRLIGDLHSCLAPLPVDFIKRSGAPDIVYMHGVGQKRIMHQWLGWDDTDVRSLPSLRLGAQDGGEVRNKILLPYSFHDAERILADLAMCFQSMGVQLPPLTIKNHPAQDGSPRHHALMEDIRALQKAYPSHDAAESNMVIVLGASSAIIECLERGMKVYQIAEDPVLDSYNPAIWLGIDVEYLSDHVIPYQMPNNPHYLQFGPSHIGMMFEND